MISLKNDNTTAFDVDQTLIYWIFYTEYSKNHESPDYFQLKYGQEFCFFKKHKAHIRFLKHCKERGDFIVVWSQNGAEWAEKIVKALNLQDYVDVVMAKPTRHVDDKENIPDIVGNRIFIKE